MAGEFIQKDTHLLEAVANTVTKRGGSVVQRYIADLSMATDIIVSSRQNNPLCIQLTTLSDDLSQEKLANWEHTLRFWQIERGLFLSYNPSTNHFLNQLINIALYNSDNLKTGVYLRFSL